MPRPVVSVLLPALLGLMACGGASSLSGGACPEPSARLQGAALEGAAACWSTATPTRSDACRQTALDAAASPTLAGTLARCVLTAADRLDGAWLAERMNAVHQRPEALRALVEAMPDAFVADLHANSWASSIGAGAQRAIGGLLPSLSEPARRLIVSLTFTWALSPLDEACQPWVRELPPDHPAVASLAEQAFQGDGFDETERFALAATGRWSARELVDCFERRQNGCSSWSGESPLALLELTAEEMDANPGPTNALRLLQSGSVGSRAEAGQITRWLTRTRFPQQELAATTLLQVATDGRVVEEVRMGVAEQAAGLMCTGQALAGTGPRMVTSEDLEPPAATSPWPTLVNACLPSMGADDLVHAFTAGGALSIPDALRVRMREALAATPDAASCSEVAALASAAASWARGGQHAGSAVAEAALALNTSCGDTWRAPLRQVLNDSTQHSWTRINAGLALVRLGDRTPCNQVDALLRWRDAENGWGPGARARALADELRSACR
jgi:hypothetical protein